MEYKAEKKPYHKNILALIKMLSLYTTYLLMYYEVFKSFTYHIVMNVTISNKI